MAADMAESQLRQAYFAQAADLVSRYGVRFERVMIHLHEARAEHANVTVSAIRQVEDLVHVVACIDGDDLAWRDLVDQHERALVRACRPWLDPTEAIVFVRQVLAELRRDSIDGAQSLRSFDGIHPLRRWLADRIIGRLSRTGLAFAASDQA